MFSLDQLPEIKSCDLSEPSSVSFRVARRIENLKFEVKCALAHSRAGRMAQTIYWSRSVLRLPSDLPNFT
jgi:hypothetical protein